MISTRTLAARLSPTLAAKADLARIGHHYATESMLHSDDETKSYDADTTSKFDTESLFEYYRALVADDIKLDRGNRAVF